jgi:hypothetical protein
VHLKKHYREQDSNLIVDHVEVLHAGPHQRFSTGLVAQGVSEDWLSIKGTQLTLKSKPPLNYRIEREPGYYCCHCKQALAAGGPEAQAHVAGKHGGKKSPDPSNPAGYERIDYFDCGKES